MALILLSSAGCQSASKVIGEYEISSSTVGESIIDTEPSTASVKETTVTPAEDKPQTISFAERVERERFILTDSDKKLLEERDMEELSANMLDMSRNEIYARHGYAFTGNDNKYYFTNKFWYKENADFKESMLNDIKKRNALFIKQYSEKTKECFKLVEGNEIEVDLNGDGTEERIKLECKAGGDTYTLYINGLSVRGQGNNLDGKMFVCDIDSKDKYREIAITESGPSSDEATYFYYYDGRKINFMGRIQGSNYVINMTGSGTFTTRTRGQILQTWFYTDRYGLSSGHELENIPQLLYMMGTRVRVQQELELQKSPTDSESAAVLKPGDEVVITSSDNKEWCEVDTMKGVKGWFAVGNFSDIKGTDYSATECFEGLCNAD